jgi:hypothetical protein
VRRLIAGLPSGSYLSLYAASDGDPAWVEAQLQYNESGAIPYYLRTREQIAGFMEGLEVVEPGVVPITAWWPDAPPTVTGPAGAAGIGGVGRKP